jgi:hypothetical protein
MGIGTFQSWVLASASISGLICCDSWASGVREDVQHDEGAHWPRNPVHDRRRFQAFMAWPPPCDGRRADRLDRRSLISAGKPHVVQATFFQVLRQVLLWQRAASC